MFTEEQILYMQFCELLEKLEDVLSELGLAAITYPGEWQIQGRDIQAKAFFKHGFERAAQGFTRDELKNAHLKIYQTLNAIDQLLFSNGMVPIFEPGLRRGERAFDQIGETLDDKTVSLIP